jgi:hypothetical protein
MEVRIDTTKDSKEDIRKVIRFLQGFVDESTSNDYKPAEAVFGSFMDRQESEPETLKEEPRPKDLFSIKDLETY